MQSPKGTPGPTGRSSQTRKHHVQNIHDSLADHPDLEWSTVADLAIGDCYTTSTKSPLTYMMLDKRNGYRGRAEFDCTTLVGPAGGRASTRTYYRGEQEILIVPPEEVGDRIAAAALAFGQRPFHGHDHIELGRDCWPLTLVPDDAEVVA